MFRTSIISLLLFCLSTGPLYSHPDPVIDSLLNQLEEANDTSQVDLFNQLSQLYWQRSFDTSLLLAEHAVALAEELDDPARLGNSLNMMGNAYYLLSNFTRGLDFYKQALNIREELGDSNNMAKTYNNIGAIHLNLQDYDQALDYFNRALAIYKGIGDDEVIFSLTNNIGAVYNEMEEYQRAIKYFSEAYEIGKRIHDDQKVLIALSNLGEVSASMEQYDQALEYFFEADKKSEKIGDIRMQAIVSLNIGSLYQLTGSQEKAYPFLVDALEQAEIINSLQVKRDAYNLLFVYYQDRNEFERALEYHMMYSDARDSMNLEEGRLKIAELELQYDAENFRTEIELLRRDNEIKRLRITQISVGLGLIILILVLVSVLLYINANRNRIKKEITSLLQEKNEELEAANKKLIESGNDLRELNATKDKFFSIIGHDLRNPLNALIGFSELITLNSREFSKEDLQKYTSIINESAKNIHQLIENLLNWSRSQTGNLEYSPDYILLQDIISENNRILQINADNKRIKMKIDVPESLQVFADKNLLSTTLRNLIGNAIKFTPEEGSVLLKARKENGYVLISVNDTGIGMNEEQIEKLFTLGSTISTPGTTKEQGTGLGLILCKEFIEMHNGKIWVESKPGEGSSFKFTIPDNNTG